MKDRAPTPLLAFLVVMGLLVSRNVREAIIAFRKQTEVWLPEDRYQGCSIICKFTKGSKANDKRLTRRLVTDQGELDFLVRDTSQSGALVGAPQKCPPWPHPQSYYDGSQPQYTHLQPSMLAYAHNNLLPIQARYEPKEDVRVATDSIYVQKTELQKLAGGGGVEAYVPQEEYPQGFCHICLTCHDRPIPRPSSRGRVHVA